MTKNSYGSSKGETWEWEETSDARKAIQRLHEDIRKSIEDLDRNSDK